MDERLQNGKGVGQINTPEHLAVGGLVITDDALKKDALKKDALKR